MQFVITSTPYVQGVIVYLSNVFDPFPELARWLGDIVSGNLPSELAIDEEGREKTFRASPVNQSEFIFEIIEPRYGREMQEAESHHLYAQVSRRQFLSEFLKAWDDFLATKFSPSEWDSGEADPQHLDFSAVRAFFAA
jgi:hypothetical protein